MIAGGMGKKLSQFKVCTADSQRMGVTHNSFLYIPLSETSTSNCMPVSQLVAPHSYVMSLPFTKAFTTH